MVEEVKILSDGICLTFLCEIRMTNEESLDVLEKASRPSLRPMIRLLLLC